MTSAIPFLLSLRCRLIVSVVLVEIIMLSILVLNNISIVQATHADRLRDTASSMIQQVANTSGRYMVAVDYASLEDYLKNITRYKELLYLEIYDRDNNRVISLGDVPKNHFPHSDNDPTHTDDNVFDVIKRISLAGQPMGEVSMGFSLAIMQNAIDKSRVRGVTIALIEIVLTILVTVIIGVGLTRRLNLLSNAAAEVEAGNYNVIVPAETCDEVGKTVLAFNRMVAEVSNRTTQLEESESRSLKLLQENRHLIHTSLEIQEEERKYLARELHDELGQCITAIQADAELIRDLSSKDRRIETSAMAIMDVSSRVYDSVHSMMHRLRPEILDNLGLVEALKDEINAWEARHVKIHCHFSTEGQLSLLSERINITLYRIVQECLTNITKHAQATRVNVTLSSDRDILSLKIVDNGVGIEKKSGNYGLGLIGMRERVELLGGKLTLNSEAGKGTSILITAPLV